MPGARAALSKGSVPRGFSFFDASPEACAMSSFVSKAVGFRGELPAPLGEAGVGAGFVRPTGGPLCKVFYPSKEKSRKADGRYCRSEAIQALARVLGKFPFLFANVVNTPHYVNLNGEPLGGEEKWPVVIFSHGLKGSCEMYSQVSFFVLFFLRLGPKWRKLILLFL